MKSIVLIHGTWCDGTFWGDFASQLEKTGLQIHTSSLRYHDLPYEEGIKKVGDVSLTDYADDLVSLVESLEEPPLLLGHSLGCLLDQMVAERTPCCWHDSHGPCPNCRYLRSLSNHACQFLTPFSSLGILEKTYSTL